MVTATIASALLLFGLILADVLTDRALSRLPIVDALHIEMTGHQWWWEVHYPADQRGSGFSVANELHIPVGRPVVVALKAGDVIHTFWVPSLHGKKDMIPGRDAIIELRADRTGTFRGQCAELCGVEHALMAFAVVAEPAPAIRSVGRFPAPARGELAGHLRCRWLYASARTATLRRRQLRKLPHGTWHAGRRNDRS